MMPNTDLKKTHGGRRENAGPKRKPAGDKAVVVSVTLLPAEKARLLEIGGGSATAGVKKMIHAESS